MTTDQQPDQPVPAASPSAEVAPAEAWKPEPRQWSWKDLFTAPMLAFKPKCMLIAAATLVVLAGWQHLYGSAIDGVANVLVRDVIDAVWWVVAVLVFALGTTLVAIFLRADLLDDEFLTVREALGQYRSRILPALLVPLFLLVLVVGVKVLLLYIPALVCSVPYAGGALYALLYPLSFAFAVFFTLILIAVALSGFVFPSIIAVRKHGWFDNVVDTIEAVGTKPHVLVGCLLLTWLMITVALGIGSAASGALKDIAQSRALPGNEVATTLTHAEAWSGKVERFMNPVAALTSQAKDVLGLGAPRGYASSSFQPNSWDNFGTRNGYASTGDTGDSYHTWGPGLIAGFWQSLIGLLILGYALNLFVAGGMLSYLLVREDDYWDDEDLEDLDKLAKELEEEAKREDAASAAATVATTPAMPAAVPPAPPEPPKPA